MRHPPAPDCPYKGLEPYEEADLAYFFGRGDDAQRIANALMTAPLTVLYGKSGVGKSSVLQAAVPPRLRDPENTLVLLWNAWQSPAFLDDLLAALFKEASIEPSGDALDQVLPGLASNLGRPVALIFDQFEEYFHYREGPRDAFEQQLARLANSGHDDIHILLSLRDDGLASLDRLRRRIPQILRSRLELKHLTEDGAREAVDGPLGVFNKVHGATITIAPALRDRIIREVSSREPGGGRRIETAYLQLALTKLWEASGGARAKSLDAGTFDTLGGATDIARQHLENVLDKLSPAERELAAVLFDRLVTPGGGKIALSATALAGYAKAAAALLGQAKTDGESVRKLLQRLTRRESRLLRPVPSPDDPNVQGFELFHDVLGQPTRAWLEREAEARKRANELEERAKELEEQRKRKRIYAIAAAIALVFAGAALGAATYALVQFQRAEDQTALAKKQTEWAEEQTRIAIDEKERAARQEMEALLDQSRAMASAAQDELEHRSPRTAALLALRGLPDRTDSNRPLFAPTQVALYQAVLRDSEELALIGHGGGVNALAFDPLGERLATASDDGTARIWNSATGELLHPLEGHVNSGAFTPEEAMDRLGGGVLALAFDPSGERLATASYDGTARIWNSATGELLHALEGHGGVVLAVAFDPSGERLATASSDGTARIWNSATGELLHPLEGHGGGVNALAFDPSGERLATASYDGTARIWNSATGELLHPLEGHGGGVNALAFDPSGERLATASSDGTARIWNSATGELLHPLEGHGGWVNALAFDPLGERLATASSDGTARIWNSATGELLHPLEGHGGWVNALAFDPSGERLATASDDGTARIWNSATGELLHPLEGHGGGVNALAFDPLGERLATASSDGTARIWNSATGELLHPLEGHGGWVNALAFDPSGERLATASSDGTARIWNSATGELLHPLEGHGGRVNALAFDPSGERLATASDDGTARIWRVFQDVNELVAFAKRGHRRLCFIETERERYFIPEEEGCLERGLGAVEAEVKP